MITLDPIIAVKDVQKSAAWYGGLFNLQRKHGGDHFAVLTTTDSHIILCLHKWGAHEHPSMMNPDIVTGNGLILYMKTDDLDSIRKNAAILELSIVEDIHTNPNSHKREFSLKDPDGYFLTISEYHEYEG